MRQPITCGEHPQVRLNDLCVEGDRKERYEYGKDTLAGHSKERPKLSKNRQTRYVPEHMPVAEWPMLSIGGSVNRDDASKETRIALALGSRCACSAFALNRAQLSCS